MESKPINIDREIMGGTPVFTGTRVPLKTLFDYLEGGDTLEEFLDDFPSVFKNHALHVLEMGKQTMPPSKNIDAVITVFSETGQYNKAFLKDLKKGLKRSSYFKRK